MEREKAQIEEGKASEKEREKKPTTTPRTHHRT